MDKYVEIIGPCSKWIEGKGWVTKIPVELLKEAGFVKSNPTVNDIRTLHELNPIHEQSSPVVMIVDTIIETEKGIEVRGKRP